MKPLGILLLAVAVGLLGYFKAYPIVIAKLGIVMPKKEIVVEAPVVEEAPAAMPEAPKIEIIPEAPKPMPKPEAPKVVDSGMGKPTKKVDADGFEQPEFQSIEDVTKNWTVLPKSSFPRPVKIMKPVDFVMVIGANKVGSKANAGSNAYALSQDGMDLILAPSQGSNARGKINLNDTDIKASLTAGYEQWKITRTAALKAAFLREKSGASQPTVATLTNRNAPAEVSNAKNDKPVKARDGSFQILLDSMKAGQVTEITTQNITKWEDVTQEEKDGKNYWVVVVGYTTKTMFGDFPTAAKAYIYNGKVEKWIYRDSGEVVP